MMVSILIMLHFWFAIWDTFNTSYYSVCGYSFHSLLFSTNTENTIAQYKHVFVGCDLQDDSAWLCRHICTCNCRVHPL